MSALPEPTAAVGSTAALVLAAAVLQAPTGQAGIRGSFTVDMTSLDEAHVTGQLAVDGDASRELRERADDNDDGTVAAYESDGAAIVAGDRLEGTNEDLRLDGTAYTNERVDVDIDGLEGPVDRATAVDLELEIEARTDPGPGPGHQLTVRPPSTGLDAEPDVGVRVHAPEGYVIADASGLEVASSCEAGTEGNLTEATVDLEPESEACPDPIPGPGLVGLGGILAAAVLRARPR